MNETCHRRTFRASHGGGRWLHDCLSEKPWRRQIEPRERGRPQRDCLFGFVFGAVIHVHRMNDDARLLRRFSREGSEAAFTELVRRHLDLVYNAALRRTGGDPHFAADVAQHVFIALARNARKLSNHTTLPAWLHTATRNAALTLVTSEQRRRARESQALALDSVDPAPDWDRLRPLLDTAIDELSEPDRAAVVLRFLERRAFAEIGAILRVSEDAARMRTERALDRLRTALARRGITSTAAALGAIVSSQPLVSAPTGLAATLASKSIAATGAGVAGSVFSTIFYMSAKTITTTFLTATAAFVIGAWFGSSRGADSPPPSAETTRQVERTASWHADNERLRAELAALKLERDRLKDRNAALAAKPPVPPTPAPARKSVTLGMSRGELQQAILNNLRQIASARDQYSLENGRVPSSVEDLVGRNGFIRQVRTVGGEDYTGLSMAPAQVLTVTTPDGISVTYDPSGATTTRPELSLEIMRTQELGRRIQKPLNQALSAYRAANNGNNPPNEQALLSYFATPQEGADFVEYLEAQKAAR